MVSHYIERILILTYFDARIVPGLAIGITLKLESEFLSQNPVIRWVPSGFLAQ